VISEFFIESISFATLLLGNLLIFIDSISSAALLLGNLLLNVLPEAERPSHMHIERSRKKQKNCLKTFRVTYVLNFRKDMLTVSLTRQPVGCLFKAVLQIRIHSYEVRIRILLSLAKIVRKTLIPAVL
jgi:hypothetical protein